MPHATTLEIVSLFRVRGGSQYGHEAVTQLEHALQAAMFAERDGADAPLVAAALLHDVGHLVHSLPDDAPEQGIDDHHETAAANWLAKRFGPEVVAPVRMHVAAKRYLCTVEPTYRELLSGPSLVSLELQGGLLSDAERAAFEASPHCAAAVRLRRWDDAAKVVGLATPPLEHFADHVDRCVIS